jgi:hypothetical protein
MSQGMRKILREYGWPDVEKYQKEACIQALKSWYRDFRVRKNEEARREQRIHWERQGITFPERSETNNMEKSESV